MPWCPDRRSRPSHRLLERVAGRVPPRGRLLVPTVEGQPVRLGDAAGCHLEQAEPAQPDGEVADGPARAGHRLQAVSPVDGERRDPVVGRSRSSTSVRPAPTAPAGAAAARRGCSASCPGGIELLVAPSRVPRRSGTRALTRCGHSVPAACPAGDSTSSASSSAALQRPSEVQPGPYGGLPVLTDRDVPLDGERQRLLEHALGRRGAGAAPRRGRRDSSIRSRPARPGCALARLLDDVDQLAPGRRRRPRRGRPAVRRSRCAAPVPRRRSARRSASASPQHVQQVVVAPHVRQVGPGDPRRAVLDSRAGLVGR